jgi:hypothetical protein
VADPHGDRDLAGERGTGTQNPPRLLHGSEHASKTRSIPAHVSTAILLTVANRIDSWLRRSRSIASPVAGVRTPNLTSRRRTHRDASRVPTLPT